jgi:uncharacterized protein with FMN-binding domain
MKRKHKIWITIGSIVIAIAVVAVVLISSMQTAMKQLASEKITDVDLSKISDGVYEGSCSVFLVSVKVEVSVENHAITDIDLVEHKSGKGAAADAIPEKVVEAQSLEVDTISGATYSSKAILKAIKDALTLP